MTEFDGTQDTSRDITGLAVDHTDRAVRLTLRLRDLLPGEALNRVHGAHPTG